MTGTVAVLRLEDDCPANVADDKDGDEPELDVAGGARLGLDEGLDPEEPGLVR